MIKINIKDTILTLMSAITDTEYESIVKVVSNPECHTPSFYDDVSFEDIVILRKELIDFAIMYQDSEFIDARNNLLGLLNKLIIDRVERLKMMGLTNERN